MTIDHLEEALMKPAARLLRVRAKDIEPMVGLDFGSVSQTKMNLGRKS
jgi:hypothetical protein